MSATISTCPSISSCLTQCSSYYERSLIKSLFLHVFHHGVMPFSWYWGVLFVPGGFGTFHAMLNSFIHLMMYTYYFLAACGDKYKRFLWWKKHMTTLQIIQFVTVMIHTSQLLFIECEYPIILAYLIWLYAFVFFCFFGHFYVNSYCASRNKKEGSKDAIRSKDE